MIIIGDKIRLKLIEEIDKEKYYKAGFENTCEEVDYFTGTKGSFTKEQIYKYVEKIVEDDTRYDFLILDKNETIVGEIVLNEINEETKISHFRIALFDKKIFNKGYGKEAISLILKFAFEKLKLHRIELEVFDFNERGIHVYKKCGFIKEGVKREAEIINNKYVDVITMGILKRDYEDLK